MTYNIYLAGKIDLEHGSWRDVLLGQGGWDAEIGRYVPRWGLRQTVNTNRIRWQDEPEPQPEWPKKPNTLVLDQHNYVGPYLILRPDLWSGNEPKSVGMFHGIEWNGQHGGLLDDNLRKSIVEFNLATIRRADLVFAYLNTPDCYGTLAEIGFASGLGKYVHLVISPRLKDDDYWFTREMVDSSSGYLDWSEETADETPVHEIIDLITRRVRPLPKKQSSEADTIISEFHAAIANLEAMGGLFRRKRAK